MIDGFARRKTAHIHLLTTPTRNRQTDRQTDERTDGQTDTR